MLRGRNQTVNYFIVHQLSTKGCPFVKGLDLILINIFKKLLKVYLTKHILNAIHLYNSQIYTVNINIYVKKRRLVKHKFIYLYGLHVQTESTRFSRQ